MSTYLTVFIQTLDGYDCSFTYNGGDVDSVDVSFLRMCNRLEDNVLCARIKNGRLTWILPSLASIAGFVDTALSAVIVRV